MSPTTPCSAASPGRSAPSGTGGGSTPPAAAACATSTVGARLWFSSVTPAKVFSRTPVHAAAAIAQSLPRESGPISRIGVAGTQCRLPYAPQGHRLSLQASACTGAPGWRAAGRGLLPVGPEIAMIMCGKRANSALTAHNHGCAGGEGARPPFPERPGGASGAHGVIDDAVIPEVSGIAPGQHHLRANGVPFQEHRLRDRCCRADHRVSRHGDTSLRRLGWRSSQSASWPEGVLLTGFPPHVP
jgi:hypothetical protein